MAQEKTLRSLMRNAGVQVIGDSLDTIAFSAIADLGSGRIRITTNAAHTLKKGNAFYITSGLYQGVYRILNVPNTTTLDVIGEFGATASGTIALLAAKNGYGFIVVKGPVTIEEFVPDPENGPMDISGFIEGVAILEQGEEVFVPFKTLRISAGDVMAVNRSPRAELSYEPGVFGTDSIQLGPILLTATVEDGADTDIVLTYDTATALDENKVPAPALFSVVGVTGDPAISSVAIDGAAKTVTLTLAGSVAEADVVTVAYLGGQNGTRDTLGNKALAFAATEVENNAVD